MQAHVRDELIIKGYRIDQPDRTARIVEVFGAGGGPPYFVRWDHDGRESLVFPGVGALVKHFEEHDADHL